MARPIGTTLPEEEKSIRRSYRLPPELLKRFEALIPDRKRSQFLHGALEAELARVERELGKKPPKPKRKRATPEEWAAAIKASGGETGPDDDLWGNLQDVGDEVVE